MRDLSRMDPEEPESLVNGLAALPPLADDSQGSLSLVPAQPLASENVKDVKEKKRKAKKLEPQEKPKAKSSPKRRKEKKGPEKNDDVNDEEEDESEDHGGRVAKRPAASTSLAMVAAGLWECRTLIHKLQ